MDDNIFENIKKINRKMLAVLLFMIIAPVFILFLGLHGSRPSGLSQYITTAIMFAFSYIFPFFLIFAAGLSLKNLIKYKTKNPVSSIVILLLSICIFILFALIVPVFFKV